MIMENTYRIADRNIQIRSSWNMVHRMCRDYLTSEKPDFCVQVDPLDIEKECEESDKTAIQESRPIRPWTDAYLETLAVYRRIAEKMPDYDTVLFHGSAIAVDGQGYLFTAPSGTGKSTHAGMWRELLGSRAVMINDDKPLLRITESGVIVYGTPWNGKHRLGSNVSAPLRAVCSLERAEENSIEEISVWEAVPVLLRQCYRPSEPAALQKTLLLLDRMTKTVQFFRLRCNTDPEAARISWQAMRPADCEAEAY